jgi:hypothetical protein
MSHYPTNQTMRDKGYYREFKIYFEKNYNNYYIF